MNLRGWPKDLKREIEQRVDGVVHRGSLGGSEEIAECRTAPDGERVHFSILRLLEDRAGSQDTDWMEPA